MAESVKQQTLSSVKWTAVEKFGGQGMQFLLGLIMARLLTPEDYGTVGMIAIFLAVSNTFIDSGFGKALIQKQDRTETDYSTVFFFNIAVSIVCYGVLFFSAPLVANFFHTEILCPILRVQAINLILNSFMQIHVAKLTVDLNFKALAQRSLMATLISGVAGVVFAFLGYGVWSIVFQGLLSTIINLLFIWIYMKWKPTLVFSWTSFKTLGGYGSKLLASGLLHTLYTNMTTFVIGRFCSAKDLGFYNRGIQFAHIPVTTIDSIILKATFPILAKIQDDTGKLVHVYRKYIRVLSIPIFFVCFMLVALAKPIILILLTEKWLPAVPYLQIFAFAMMFDHISTLNLNLLQVKGYTNLYLKLEVIKKSISMIILFSAIPFGAIGICISKVIYSQIAVYINTYYTGKYFSLTYFSQVKDYLKYFIVGLVACLPSFFISEFLSHPWISLGLGVIVSPIIYYLLLRNDEYFNEIIDILLSKI